MVARLVLTVLACAALALTGFAQKSKADVCPWCKNDPETMQKAGIVSHGSMPIGPWTSDDLQAKLPGGQWIVIETAHLRFASSLPETNVELAEQARVRSELDRLRVVLPSVPSKVKTLDPWLRLHLIAMKAEEFYTRFQKLLAVTDEDFPAQRTFGTPYMGDGKFLGEREKFEVVLHATRASHNLFTKDFTGAQVTGALRWHFQGVHKMLASIPCEDSDLKKDRWLFPHIVHNLTHLFFCAYKHFSYDPPTWLDEGLALAMEKEIEPRSATNEGEEGTYRDRVAPPDWTMQVRKMIAGGDHKRISELMHIREVGALDPDALYTCWSVARYLIEQKPQELARLLGQIKGQLDDKGYPNGSDMPGIQRQAFKEILDWSPQEFTEQWLEWAKVQTESPGK